MRGETRETNNYDARTSTGMASQIHPRPTRHPISQTEKTRGGGGLFTSYLPYRIVI